MIIEPTWHLTSRNRRLLNNSQQASTPPPRNPLTKRSDSLPRKPPGVRRPAPGQQPFEPLTGQPARPGRTCTSFRMHPVSVSASTAVRQWWGWPRARPPPPSAHLSPTRLPTTLRAPACSRPAAGGCPLRRWSTSAARPPCGPVARRRNQLGGFGARVACPRRRSRKLDLRTLAMVERCSSGTAEFSCQAAQPVGRRLPIIRAWTSTCSFSAPFWSSCCCRWRSSSWFRGAR